jgi:hypothetical protein
LGGAARVSSTNGYKRKAVIDLENPKPYEVEITTSSDGEHYQITLKPDMNDKSTWCKAAAFSDDAGVIFLGAALDCDASAKSTGSRTIAVNMALSRLFATAWEVA